MKYSGYNNRYCNHDKVKSTLYAAGIFFISLISILMSVSFNLLPSSAVCFNSDLINDINVTSMIPTDLKNELPQNVRLQCDEIKVTVSELWAFIDSLHSVYYSTQKDDRDSHFDIPIVIEDIQEESAAQKNSVDLLSSKEDCTIQEASNETVTDTDSPGDAPYWEDVDMTDFRQYRYFTDPESGFTYEIPMSEYYQKIAYACCQRYSVDYDIAMGLFGVETAWNAEIGQKGRYIGIGMLHIGSNYLYCLQNDMDLYTPEGGIEASIELLSRKIQTWGSISKALVAYNCGDTGAYQGYFSRGYTSSYYSRRVLAFAQAIF